MLLAVKKTYTKYLRYDFDESCISVAKKNNAFGGEKNINSIYKESF